MQMSMLQQELPKRFDENLKKRFANRYIFSKDSIDKFILLLQKGVYPYEYMNVCYKFKDTPLPQNEDFYSHLKMKDITDADYTMQ